MEIQLNAAPEEEEDAPPTSHAVSMASLLSGDNSTPRTEPVSPPQPRRTGLSSLMNSPLPDAPTSDAPVADTPIDDDVEMEETNISKPTLPTLQDPELEAIKTELQTALQRQFDGNKRHKKGKNARRGRAAHSAAAEAQVLSSMTKLQQKINSQMLQTQTLQETVSLSLAFCALLDEKDPIQSLLVLSPQKLVDVDATVDNLQRKPLYGQLLGVVRRAVLSCGEEQAKELLKFVLDWCLDKEEPHKWTWVLAVVAQMNSYCIQEFLFREAIARYHIGKEEQDEIAYFLPVLELLAMKHPAQMVDIVRDLLEECSGESGEVAVGQGLPIVTVVKRLVALASDSAALVTACDSNLQWIVTEELAFTLANKFEVESVQEEANGNGSAHSLEVLLLQFLHMRSSELSSAGFQLILLLQNMSASELSPSLSDSVASFQKKLLDFASAEFPQKFTKGVYRYLPYICQIILRLLKVTTSVDEDETMEAQPSENMSKEVAQLRFDEWKRWLCLLAQKISRKDVTDQLIKAELMSAEFNELPLAVPLTAVQPADRALCELLTALLTPPSPEYVEFVRTIVQECRGATPRARRRILDIIQSLLRLNDTEDLIPTTSDFPVTLHAPTDQAASCLAQLADAKNWRDSQNSFALWRGVSGIDFWESFLELAQSKDATVSSRALSLVSRTPFLSLEDPSWQYRCLRKLSTVFFSLLRQYRTELVLQKGGDNSAENLVSGDLQNRLQALKMNLFRVLVLDGGVAHYATSVYSMFASLWLDALLSTTSATSIPTHFPNGVNFADLDANDDSDLLDERVLIRCERTISSKCTNLQSSQVITKVPETQLVYRKTLDSTWEREMHAARVCSVYATDLFSQVLTFTGTAATLLFDPQAKPKSTQMSDEDEVCERRLKIIVDMLLERVIPCCGIPSDEVYKDTLPNRSSFDVDLRLEQWLNHFPAFLPLLRAVITTSTALGSSQALRLVPVFKSALIVLLGHWNSVKGELSVENVDVPPYMRNQNQLALSCELMRLLRATNWLPVPLGKTAELLPLTTPADIRAILFSCWFYLSDHPPRSGSRAPTPATSATTSPISSGSSPAGFSISGLSTGGSSSSSSRPPIEFYLIPLRKALHRNIHKIGAKYPLFMC